jgi:molybdopterin synthase sulfur carrier subunit
MSVEVKIPTVLRKHTNNEAVLQATGATIRELLDDISGKFPEFREKVMGEDGNLHRFINVYANDEDVRYLEGLDTKVRDGDSVSILPAVAGGAGRGVRRAAKRGGASVRGKAAPRSGRSARERARLRAS